jgi:hypothetical protein
MATTSKTKSNQWDFTGLALLTDDVVATNLFLGGTAFTVASLGALAGVTAGTVTASKAVVVNANKDIGTARYIRATKIIDGATATSDATAGARTWTAVNRVYCPLEALAADERGALARAVRVAIALCRLDVLLAFPHDAEAMSDPAEAFVPQDTHITILADALPVVARTQRRVVVEL